MISLIMLFERSHNAALFILSCIIFYLRELNSVTSTWWRWRVQLAHKALLFIIFLKCCCNIAKVILQKNHLQCICNIALQYNVAALQQWCCKLLLYGLLETKDIKKMLYNNILYGFSYHLLLLYCRRIFQSIVHALGYRELYGMICNSRGESRFYWSILSQHHRGRNYHDNESAYS